ncbi:hypothetical protein D9619_003566 [Psilocybe cf. subviscida]|uniref:Uncharacterized protein n=1 Tax=Psilocybe cf. subviscida TaxID=2480587 RepID=A0A8H5AX50_9AGAR|nr:hypothetical protein D9619_003566 [Psilocybe cf. subviscida]
MKDCANMWMATAQGCCDNYMETAHGDLVQSRKLDYRSGGMSRSSAEVKCKATVAQIYFIDVTSRHWDALLHARSATQFDQDTQAQGLQGKEYLAEL